MLRRTIGGYARHANFAAVLIIGLGCESNQMSRLVEDQALPTGERIHTLVIQEMGGTKKTVDAAIERIRELLPAANAVQRRILPAKHLTLGLNGRVRTASRRSPPTRPWASPPTCWCATVAPRSSARRRRSTARSICCSAVRSATRWGTSCSICCAGGKPIPRATMSRSTTTHRPATRPAASPPSSRNRSARRPRADGATWSTSTDTPSR